MLLFKGHMVKKISFENKKDSNQLLDFSWWLLFTSNKITWF